MRNMRPSQSVAGGMQQFHNFLQANGFVYESLPEEFILDGRVSLGDFDVVLLPPALYMPVALQTQLAAFVNNGGTLVALSDLPEADELHGQLTHSSGRWRPQPQSQAATNCKRTVRLGP